MFTMVVSLVRDDDEFVTCFHDCAVTLRMDRRFRGVTEAIFYSGDQSIRKGVGPLHKILPVQSKIHQVLFVRVRIWNPKRQRRFSKNAMRMEKYGVSIALK